MSFVEIINHPNRKEVILSREELHNAFNEQMISEITDVFVQINSEFSSDPESKEQCTQNFIVLRGKGKSFCAGADLNWMKSMVDYSLEENEKDSLALFDMFAAIKNCVLPVIAMVQGNVFGGGLGLVAACDLVFAEDDTKFCFSEVRLGLIPAVISPFVLNKVSTGKASDWMLTARVFGASEALISGLISFSGSMEIIEEKLKKTIKSFSGNGPEALRECKKLISEVSEKNNWKDARELTAKKIAERRVSKEGQSGLKSFLNKEKPSWIVSNK